MSVQDIILAIENTQKTPYRRNRNTDRSLKLDDTVYRMHRKLLEKSPVLAMLANEYDRTLLKLDHLRAEQENFTPCGLNMALDWIYGKRIEFTPLE
ncbi:unnamed protein product, partial [Cylicocyclus nassatus]